MNNRRNITETAHKKDKQTELYRKTETTRGRERERKGTEIRCVDMF